MRAFLRVSRASARGVTILTTKGSGFRLGNSLSGGSTRKLPTGSARIVWPGKRQPLTRQGLRLRIRAPKRNLRPQHRSPTQPLERLLRAVDPGKPKPSLLSCNGSKRCHICLEAMACAEDSTVGRNPQVSAFSFRVSRLSCSRDDTLEKR